MWDLLTSELSPDYVLRNRLKRLSRLQLPGKQGKTAISCQSTTQLGNITNGSIDYVFLDPPFGNNLHYSELNFFWEAWLGILTERQPEAVMDVQRHRKLFDYQELMVQAFKEVYRVLKPGRWLTVEFHNSKNAVWNAIQESMLRAGFVVADVRTLDKQQETYKQSIQKLVKQDLVISAYKPNDNLEERFRLQSGSTDGAWDFVRYHLGQLPVVVEKKRRVRNRGRAPGFPALRPHGGLPHPARGVRPALGGRILQRPAAALRRARWHVLPARAGPRLRFGPFAPGSRRPTSSVRQGREERHPVVAPASRTVSGRRAHHLPGSAAGLLAATAPGQARVPARTAHPARTEFPAR